MGGCACVHARPKDAMKSCALKRSVEPPSRKRMNATLFEVYTFF